MRTHPVGLRLLQLAALKQKKEKKRKEKKKEPTLSIIKADTFGEATIALDLNAKLDQ